jgi:D-lactate dehydrogenase
VPTGLSRSLERAVRGVVVLPGPELTRLGRDESHVGGPPLAAVRPVDADDVVALVRWARRHGIGLVARGGGTSLDGESATLDGGVVVDFSGWDAIGPVDVGGRSVRVGPGVVNFDLQSALRPFGVFYPPNPGSWTASTLGGNVGTNASGPRSFGYGPTRRWVREVEAVLGTGERVRLGSRVEKRSVGPDLLQLFIGSEGTLGVATSLTLRLAPIPEVRRGWAIPLPPRVRLSRVAQVLASRGGTGLSAVEYLDRESAEGINLDRRARWPVGSALLLLELEASSPAEARLRNGRVRSALRAAGVTAPPAILDDADRLWSLRGEASRVLDERYGARVREDVAVPLDRVDALCASVRRIARKAGVRVFLFGHLGEGSLHPNFEVDPRSAAAGRIRAAVWSASLALGGTISGEHGIGRLKRDALEAELGSSAIDLLRAVRRACDPDGILNPGKLYPRATATGGRPSPSLSGGGGETARPASPNGGGRRGVARRSTPRTRATSR